MEIRPRRRDNVVEEPAVEDFQDAPQWQGGPPTRVDSFSGGLNLYGQQNGYESEPQGPPPQHQNLAASAGNSNNTPYPSEFAMPNPDGWNILQDGPKRMRMATVLESMVVAEYGGPFGTWDIGIFPFGKEEDITVRLTRLRQEDGLFENFSWAAEEEATHEPEGSLEQVHNRLNTFRVKS